MSTSVRWLVAALVTAAAFAVPAWLCGAVLLPLAMTDGAARWGIATAAGLALAALAALWGQSFASAAPRSGDDPAAAGTDRSGDTRNAISGGSVGPVVQARDISGPVVLGGDDTRRPPA